ncbi:hypothetical protein PFISCL1PPCAC_28143, partial [Pristionchus fissidentatus]
MNISRESSRARNSVPRMGTRRSRSLSARRCSGLTSESFPNWEECACYPTHPVTKRERHPLWVYKQFNEAVNEIPRPIVDIWDPKMHKRDKEHTLPCSRVSDWLVAEDPHSNAAAGKDMLMAFALMRQSQVDLIVDEIILPEGSNHRMSQTVHEHRGIKGRLDRKPLRRVPRAGSRLLRAKEDDDLKILVTPRRPVPSAFPEPAR